MTSYDQSDLAETKSMQWRNFKRQNCFIKLLNMFFTNQEVKKNQKFQKGLRNLTYLKFLQGN